MSIRHYSRSALLLAALLLSVISLSGCPPPSPVQVPPKYVPPPSARGLRYTIQEGDTFYSIARRYNVDWRDILDANRMLDPHDLRVGQVIVIPGVEEVPPPEAALPAPAHNPGHPGPIPAESKFVWPLRGKILCRFGRPVPWRMNDTNRGLDIKAAPSEIVSAAKSGRVNTFEKVPGYGHVVELEHRDGTVTFYGHLERILVTHGRWVKQGERIGTAGSTGLSSGTELHFRILRNDRFINPLPLLPK